MSDTDSIDAAGSLLFIETSVFSRTIRELGLEDGLRDLQNQLMANPRLGPIDPGTGGLRKARIGMPGRGKRGGARVHYLYFPDHSAIHFVLAYAKNERSSLTGEEKVRVRRLVTIIRAERERKG
jgi:hypothetical protein